MNQIKFIILKIELFEASKSSNMKLIGKTFFTPYFIFIKDKPSLSDVELLDKLDLKNYQLITDRNELEEVELKRYLYITEDENWKHLMDDMSYTLWHDKDVKSRIKI